MALVFFLLGVVASFGFGLEHARVYDHLGGQSTDALLAAVVILFGCVAAWLGSITLYGYGQLIEDNAASRALLEELVALQRRPAEASPAKDAPQAE